MGLRETFRNALGSIAAALPDATHTLRHGEDEHGAVVQSSSRDFAEAVSESGPTEVARYIANGADFPTLEEGSAVELDGGLRVVVSMKADAIGATFAVGLTAELEKCRAAYRRPGTRLSQPVDVLAVEGEVIDPDGDAFAPTTLRQWTVALPVESWLDPAEPQIGDAIELEGANLRVASVSKRDGFFIISARARRA